TGAALALQVLSRTLHPDSPILAKNRNAEPAGEPFPSPAVEPRLGKQRPRWDPDRKELRFGDCVINQFRWAAANHEPVLMPLEEENWPRRIDDPLPQKLNQEPKARLHDTIKCLNRNHRKRLVHFSGDGTGEGIVWAFLDGTELEV